MGKTAIKTLFDSIFVFLFFVFFKNYMHSLFLLFTSPAFCCWWGRDEKDERRLEIAWWPGFQLSEMFLGKSKTQREILNTAEKKGGSRVTRKKRENNNIRKEDRKKGLPYFYGPPFFRLDPFSSSTRMTPINLSRRTGTGHFDKWLVYVCAKL